jgi:hypothetical protein
MVAVAIADAFGADDLVGLRLPSQRRAPAMKVPCQGRILVVAIPPNG